MTGDDLRAQISKRWAMVSLHILSRANATDQESGFQPAVRKRMLAATKPGGTP
jgi:hypothetical protein